MVSANEVLTLSILEGIYYFLAGLSVALGLTTVCFMTIESSWLMAFCLYSAATVFRLGAGAVMNRMGEVTTNDTVNAWNNRYHRFVVIVLNAMVGVVLLGRLVWDARLPNPQHLGPLVFLATAFAIYFLAAKFTRPNTFGARMRSATLTVVLVCMMAYLAWPGHLMNILLAGVATISFVSINLRRLQHRFGWADR